MPVVNKINTATTISNDPIINWNEAGEEKSAYWHSENDTLPPKRVLIADDSMTADTAYRLTCEGNALLWRGDFQNARQLLQAITRRIDHKPAKNKTKQIPLTPPENFHRHRLAQSQRSRILNLLLLPFNADHSIPLRRAPDAQSACIDAYGTKTEPYIASLRGLQGIIGAYEWRKSGIKIPSLGARIHPHYGVFSPIRNEYIQLVAKESLPKLITTQSIAFDIGTGTGVLAAVLARREIKHITATDQDSRAINCANENLTKLQLNSKVKLVQTDLFPEGKAALIVCNPPWIPARPSSPLEYAIFDPDSKMLRGFLHGLKQHLLADGEGWLILSDIAEHLGLRTRAQLLELIYAAGLQVLNKTDIKPNHPRVSDSKDLLHAARAAELTSLWRLAIK